MDVLYAEIPRAWCSWALHETANRAAASQTVKVVPGFSKVNNGLAGSGLSEVHDRDACTWSASFATADLCVVRKNIIYDRGWSTNGILLAQKILREVQVLVDKWISNYEDDKSTQNRRQWKYLLEVMSRVRFEQQQSSRHISPIFFLILGHHDLPAWGERRAVATL